MGGTREHRSQSGRMKWRDQRLGRCLLVVGTRPIPLYLIFVRMQVATPIGSGPVENPGMSRNVRGYLSVSGSCSGWSRDLGIPSQQADDSESSGVWSEFKILRYLSPQGSLIFPLGGIPWAETRRLRGCPLLLRSTDAPNDFFVNRRSTATGHDFLDLCGHRTTGPSHSGLGVATDTPGPRWLPNQLRI